MWTACDLHLHSNASTSNDEWYSKAFGCPESYATPLEQYEACKRRGMTLVTLTDHDTIAGGLELLDRPDFFLSEEITSRFPEHDVDIHVLAWNITPRQHDLIVANRDDVYKLVDLLRRERIVHACAHPLFGPNNKLSVETLEKVLVLFPILEGINGLTDRRLEGDLNALLAGLDPKVLDALAARHGLPAPNIVKHRLAAGSDDHARRHCASAFTTLARPGRDAEGLLAALARGETRCHGHNADLHVIQLSASRIAYHFLDARKLERPSYRDPLLDLIDVVAGRETAAAPPTGIRDEMVRSLLAGAARTSTPLGPQVDPHGLDDHGVEADARVMATIQGTHDGLIGRAFDELIDGIGDLDLYRVMGGVRDLCGAVATAMPFIFAAHHFGKQRELARGVLSKWTASPRPPNVGRLAIFSDSLEQVDGVTTSLRRFIQRAVADGYEVRVPYCGERPPDVGAENAGVCVPLASASTRATDIYDGMRLHLPSLLGTIDWLWRQDISSVELSSPGPMGIIGLVAARVLGLPTTASYHTEVPELLHQLSQSPLVHRISRSLVGWFYGAVDRVFVFSESSRLRLVELGVAKDKIEHVPVAIDPDEFSPRFACQNVYKSFGVTPGGGPIVLSVGRLSQEKNVATIIEAMTRLRERPCDAEKLPTLVIVGDGPERAALERSCADRPWVVFVGLQTGDTLRRLYASASAFVFASKIDTLGLVTLEAMASGLPVLVPIGSAIAEIVKHERTGYYYELGVDGLTGMLTDVLASPLRTTVAQNARNAMVERWARTRANEVWHSHSMRAARALGT